MVRKVLWLSILINHVQKLEYLAQARKVILKRNISHIYKRGEANIWHFGHETGLGIIYFQIWLWSTVGIFISFLLIIWVQDRFIWSWCYLKSFVFSRKWKLISNIRPAHTAIKPDLIKMEDPGHLRMYFSSLNHRHLKLQNPKY